MKLNPDCVRDVLLCVEEHTGLRKYAIFTDLELHSQTAELFLDEEELSLHEYQKELMEKYSCDELIYHINYCVESGLIKESSMTAGDTIWIEDLTPSGHEFLANIRDKKQWGAVKKGLNSVRCYSLEAISAMAKGIANAAISSYLDGISPKIP